MGSLGKTADGSHGLQELDVRLVPGVESGQPAIFGLRQSQTRIRHLRLSTESLFNKPAAMIQFLLCNFELLR